jgi:hypothetical protein
MTNDTLRVDFTPDGPGRRDPAADVFWSVAAAICLVTAVALFVRLAPYLLLIPALALVLATLSTWRAAKRRQRWTRLGWPAPPIGVRTFLGFLAAWFFGLFAIVPLIFLGAVAFVVVICIVGVILVAAFLAALFKAE